MASQAFVVLVGVDTLVVNAKYPCQVVSDEMPEASNDVAVQNAIPEHLADQLGLWLDAAKNAAEPVKTTWTHEARTLLMYPHGTPTHRYLLKNGFIDLMMGPLLNNGAPARVRFCSEYLWRHGVDEALITTHAFLWERLQAEVQVQPSDTLSE